MGMAKEKKKKKKKKKRGITCSLYTVPGILPVYDMI